MTHPTTMSREEKIFEDVTSNAFNETKKMNDKTQRLSDLISENFGFSFFQCDVMAVIIQSLLTSRDNEWREKIEKLKKTVPSKPDIRLMELTMTNLELAEKAVEFHAYNQALDDLLEQMEDKK